MLLAFLLGLGFGFGSTPQQLAYACSCPPTPTPGGIPPGPAQALNAADAVFEGVAVRSRMERISEHHYRFRTTFRVRGTWKGVDSPEVDVHSIWYTSVLYCGPHFDLGDRYIVFADRHDWELMVSPCGRTRRYDARAAAALGRPRLPPGALLPWPPRDPPECNPECESVPDLRSAVDAAEAAFVGRLVEVSTQGPGADWVRVATLENLGWWKGGAEARVRVRIAHELWDCDPVGRAFFGDSVYQHVARPFVVIAGQDADGRLVLEPCSASRYLDEEILTTLGPTRPAQTPLPSATATATPTSTSTPRARILIPRLERVDP